MNTSNTNADAAQSAASFENYKTGGGFDFDLYQRNQMLLGSGTATYKAMKTVCLQILYLTRHIQAPFSHCLLFCFVIFYLM